jgi:hypothetical protein
VQIKIEVAMIVDDCAKFDWLIILKQPMAITCRVISGTQNK